MLDQLRRSVSIYDNSGVFGTFERAFRELHSRNFALLTNSGTSALCDDVGALLVEDCSHAHGSTDPCRIVGSRSYAAAWSLQGSKTITGGEGGILCTDDDELYYRALLYGHYNRRCSKEIPESHPLFQYRQTGFGLKLRAHPLAVALAFNLLNRLDKILEGRDVTAHRFAAALRGSRSLKHAVDRPGRKSWYAFPIVANTSDGASAIMEYAASRDALEFDLPGSTGDVSRHPILGRLPLPQFGLLAHVDWARSRFENARDLSGRLIKLPIWTADSRHASVVEYYAGILREIASAY